MYSKLVFPIGSILILSVAATIGCSKKSIAKKATKILTGKSDGRSSQQKLIDDTKLKLKHIKMQCSAFSLKMGSQPTGIEDLVSLPKGMMKAKWKGPYLEDEKSTVDSWGNKIWIESETIRHGHVRFTVKSMGPNGTKGDDDDIIEK